MRFSIYEQFVVGVVRPNGGWSKGRPIAYIEEADKCVPLFDLLIPNHLDEQEIACYVSEKFEAFARPGKRVAPLADTPIYRFGGRALKRQGVARSAALAGVQR